MFICGLLLWTASAGNPPHQKMRQDCCQCRVSWSVDGLFSVSTVVQVSGSSVELICKLIPKCLYRDVLLFSELHNCYILSAFYISSINLSCNCLSNFFFSSGWLYYYYAWPTCYIPNLFLCRDSWQLISPGKNICIFSWTGIKSYSGCCESFTYLEPDVLIVSLYVLPTVFHWRIFTEWW